jgi:hypothetical protein
MKAILMKFVQKNMRDNSNTFIYIVASIIFLHFLIGFIWLVIKFSKKSKNEEEK